MGLKGLMKTQPATLSPGASVLEACRIMSERKLSAVAVVEEGKLRGILTQGDVLARVVLSKRDPEKVMISEVMTQDVVTITAERSCGDALRLMVERGSFLRTFTVPDNVDETKVMGEFKDGLLNVHLPKTEKAKPKAVEVKVA